MLGLGEIIPLEVDTNKVGPVKDTGVVVSPIIRSLVTDTLVVVITGSLILSVCTVIFGSVRFSVVSANDVEIKTIVAVEVSVIDGFVNSASISVTTEVLEKDLVSGLVSKFVSSVVVSREIVVSGLVSKFSLKVVFT